MKIALRIHFSFIIALITNQAAATRFEFTAGNRTRIVSILHQHHGWDVPCKVRYHKLLEGNVSYPWEAENTKGYCAEKAQLLAEKLQKLGWNCMLEPSQGLLHED